MRKILWSGFCGMLLCVPMFLSAQSDEIPAAEPAMLEFATEDVMPTAEPMLLELEEEAVAMPAMEIEILENSVEVSDEAPVPTLYEEMPMMDEMPMEDMVKRMGQMEIDNRGEFNPEKAEFVENFAAGFVIFMVLIIYIGLPALIIGLMIKASRKNWATKKKKEKSVGYAGFWKRVAIKVFDKVINIAIVPAFFSLYYYFRDGQTIGDKVFGAKLVDKNTHEMASVGKLMMRFIAKIVSCIALGVGFWPAGWRKEKNAWHDSLSDTRYISTKKTHGAWIVLTIVLAFILPLLLVIPAIMVSMSQLAPMGTIAI